MPIAISYSARPSAQYTVGSTIQLHNPRLPSANTAAVAQRSPTTNAAQFHPASSIITKMSAHSEVPAAGTGDALLPLAVEEPEGVDSCRAPKHTAGHTHTTS